MDPPSAAAFVRLDDWARVILRCPNCKGKLRAAADGFFCTVCEAAFGRAAGSRQPVWDFRWPKDAQVLRPGSDTWSHVQRLFEASRHRAARIDDFASYRQEIDSVRELYTQEFQLSGRILDVGGHQGKLRHFLAPSALYISIDPFADAFDELATQPNLLRAYPVLQSECNFVAGHGEHLPFAAEAFDWVHMRSVIDHFRDPIAALAEAHRVLVPGGRLLVGTALHDEPVSDLAERGFLRRLRSLRGRLQGKLRREGPGGVLAAALVVIRRQPDHVSHWSRDLLCRLIGEAGFDIEREVWQKPPYEMCLYLTAIKRPVRK